MNHRKRPLLTAWIVAISLIGAAPLRAADDVEQRIAKAVEQSQAADEAERQRGVAALTAAIKELEALGEKSAPAEAHRQFLLGKACLYSERLEMATQHIDKALALAPDVAEYHCLRGEAFEAANNAPMAEKEFAKATALAPKESRYWYELGIFRAGANRDDAALAAFRKAVEANPTNAKAFLEIGAILTQQGKLDDALEMFKKAVAIDPTYVKAQANVGQIDQIQGKHAEALAAFRAVLKLNPLDSKALAKVIQCEDALGQFKERDVDHAAMLKLHQAGKVREAFFCRDQFSVGKTKLMVFEYFELRGRSPARYSFNVFDDAGKEVQYRIRLGSSEMDNQIAFEHGDINKDERVYFVDVDYPDGKHETIGHYIKKEPSYDDIKRLAIAKVKGEVVPMSSFTPAKGGGGKIELKK